MSDPENNDELITDPSKFLVSDVVLPEGLDELMADRHKAESQVLLEQADRVRELVMEAQQKRRDEQQRQSQPSVPHHPENRVDV